MSKGNTCTYYFMENLLVKTTAKTVEDQSLLQDFLDGIIDVHVLGDVHNFVFVSHFSFKAS